MTEVLRILIDYCTLNNLLQSIFIFRKGFRNKAWRSDSKYISAVFQSQVPDGLYYIGFDDNMSVRVTSRYSTDEERIPIPSYAYSIYNYRLL